MVELLIRESAAPVQDLAWGGMVNTRSVYYQADEVLPVTIDVEIETATHAFSTQYST